MEKCAKLRRLIIQTTIIQPMKECWLMKKTVVKMTARIILRTGITTLNWK